MLRKLTLIFFLCFLYVNTSAESAREFFKYAKFNFDTKEYDKALEFIDKAIEMDPGYINGFLLRAEINFGLQNFNDVIGDITNAFNLDEEAAKILSDFHLLRGDAYFKLRDLDKASTDVNICIKINPQNAKAHYLKAIINTEKSDYFEAVENFDQAIKFNASESDYYFKRAELKKKYYKPMYGTNEYESIMTDIHESISLAPSDHRPYELWCDMLKLNKGLKKEDLIQELDAFIDQFPDHADFYSERGMAKVLNYEYKLAISDFTKAMQLDKFNEANYRNRGLCFHNLKKYQLALNDYSRSINILIGKYQKSQKSESIKKILAQTFTMRAMTNELNGNQDLACDDYYSAAKLGSKPGLNNYKKKCNVYKRR